MATTVSYRLLLVNQKYNKVKQSKVYYQQQLCRSCGQSGTSECFSLSVMILPCQLYLHASYPSLTMPVHPTRYHSFSSKFVASFVTVLFWPTFVCRLHSVKATYGYLSASANFVLVHIGPLHKALKSYFVKHVIMRISM